LTDLALLAVDNNQLTGSIPALSGSRTSTISCASNNQLDGLIPVLTGLVNVQYFDVHANQRRATSPI
jgi:hypothetical protein